MNGTAGNPATPGSVLSACNGSDAAAIAQRFEELFGVKILDAARGTSSDASVVAVPKGVQLLSLKPFLDEFLQRPERRRGTATIGDLQSFIAFLDRYSSDDTVIFADPNRTNPKLVAVLNHHPVNLADAKEILAGFGDHRAVYELTLSDEWKAWVGKNEKSMNQAEFAAFLEDRIGDVILAMDDHKALMDLLKLVGGKFASPSDLLNLSRGISISANVSVKNVVTLGTGEINLQYSETHSNGEGAPISVPNLFAIAIPVFYAGEAWRIAVRLRYRMQGPAVMWSYSLYRADRVFDEAFNGVVKELRDAQEYSVFIGAQEK